MNKEMLEAEVYEDGIKLSFNLTQFPEWKFQALSNFIQCNRKLNKIEVADLYLEKDDWTHISIKGVSKDLVPEFLKMIEFEILQPIDPKFYFQKLFDKPLSL